MQSCIKEKNREKCEKIIGQNGEEAAANAQEEQQTSSKKYIFAAELYLLL